MIEWIDLIEAIINDESGVWVVDSTVHQDAQEGASNDDRV